MELGNGPATKGHAAIVAALTPSAGSTFSLDWTPEDASVAASDDLGYTWGHYTLTAVPQDKPPVIQHGKYLTVWKRDPGTRRWQAIADVGSPD